MESQLVPNDNSFNIKADWVFADPVDVRLASNEPDK